MKEVKFTLDDTALTFLRVLAERVGDTALLQVTQNLGPVNLGTTLNKYKPVIVLLAEFLRKSFLESTNSLSGDEIKAEAEKVKTMFIDVLENARVAPDSMPPPHPK
jgi:hypothetical protein